MKQLAKIVRWTGEECGSDFLKWIMIGTMGEILTSHACIETALNHMEKINKPLRNKV